MRSKPHAQAVFDHGHGVVAETAERTNVFETFLHDILVGKGLKVVLFAGTPVRDVLAGRGRRLAKDAQMVVLVVPPVPNLAPGDLS